MPTKKQFTLGVSGDIGSFSEEAALLYAHRTGHKYTLVYLMDMEGVLNAVERKKVDLGIFPVVNFRGGLVSAAFKAMGRHLFTPVDEVWLDVHQCLLAQPGVSIQQIRKVVSHPQALAQCQHYLQRECKKAIWVEWSDTAKAARDLKEKKLTRYCAVIASEQAANLYGLQVLARNIQDNHPNLTAFIVVKS